MRILLFTGKGGVGKTTVAAATAVKAAKALGLSVAGVDMLPSTRGPLVMEVNSSPGLEGIERATKIDIADRIIQFIERHHKTGRRDKVGA